MLDEERPLQRVVWWVCHSPYIAPTASYSSRETERNTNQGGGDLDWRRVTLQSGCDSSGPIDQWGLVVPEGGGRRHLIVSFEVSHVTDATFAHGTELKNVQNATEKKRQYGRNNTRGHHHETDEE